MTRQDRFAGCLLAGAVGDALGAGIEFMTLSEIRAKFGPEGVVGLTRTYGGWGRITDDSQMSFFTAEGLLRAALWRADPLESIRLAYLRWYRLQRKGETEPGLVSSLPEMAANRAPGHTCLSALADGGIGTPSEPLNSSKGCGAVMRSAPIGLASAEPYALAARAGALTHGHPSGYLSAAALALIVARVCDGSEIREAAAEAMGRLVAEASGAESSAALEAALALADSGRRPTAERVESLGQGWVGEEALAIAVYCALTGDDPRHALCLAVNHGGDSDSTGAIAGNILGARHGVSAIPTEWLKDLELRSTIETLAADLAEVAEGTVPSEGDPGYGAWVAKYPAK